MINVMEGETTRGRNDSGRNVSGRTGKWAKRPVTVSLLALSLGRLRPFKRLNSTLIVFGLVSVLRPFNTF